MNTIDSDLKRRIHDLAQNTASAIFRQTDEWQPSANSLEGCANKASASDIRNEDVVSLIRGPILRRDLNEGKLIETAIAMALAASGANVLQGKKFAITKPDRALAEANNYSRLAKVRPPAAGDFICMFEIDIIAHYEATGSLDFIDVKRALGHPEEEELHLINLQAGTLAARRVFEHGDYQTTDSRLATIRWLPPDKAAPGNVLTRETVDVGLKAPIREAVDHAIAVFRSEFDRSMMSLIARATSARKEPESPPKRATNSRPATVSPTTTISIEEAYKRGMRWGRATR